LNIYLHFYLFKLEWHQIWTSVVFNNQNKIMNTGQMMITIAAMMLLSLVILRVNNGFLNTNIVLMETKFGVLGVSIATSVMEEASGKAFDEKTDSSSITKLNDLSSIGPDGETYSNFDDFDDYDGYSRIVDDMPSAVFKISCEVDYVKTDDPESVSASKTWNKKLTITVTSPSSTDTIQMSTIYSYFYYR